MENNWNNDWNGGWNSDNWNSESFKTDTWNNEVTSTPASEPAPIVSESPIYTSANEPTPVVKESPIYTSANEPTPVANSEPAISTYTSVPETESGVNDDSPADEPYATSDFEWVMPEYQDIEYGYGGESPRRRKKEKKESTAKYITRRGLALAMILTMLATSLITVGGLAALGMFNRQAYGPSGSSGDTTVTSHNPSSSIFSVADATQSSKSVQEIVSMNENAVVEIRTESVVTDFWIQNYITQGAGSGVIINSNGYILTCNHVIENANTITVTTKNGAQYQAEVVGTDEQTDVAVIKIQGSGFDTAVIGDSSSLTIGDMAVAIGNPLGKLGGSASVGIISALDRNVEVEGKAMTLLQTDASINPGNSGGGLFDGYGNLIGIVVAKASDTSTSVEGIGFAIPINQATSIAEELIENGRVRRPLIGVMLVDVSTEAAAKEYGVDDTGLYIDDVIGKNAMEAGLQKGDIIKAINGVTLKGRDDLTKEINKNQVGDTVTITVMRDGELIDIESVLQEAE